jgi:hypothetical protein
VRARSKAAHDAIMNASLVCGEIGVGAAILAVWLEIRIGERRPSSLRARMAHAAAAFVLVQASSSALAHLIHEDTPARTSATLLLLLFLPALVYAFVVGMWLLRTLKEIVA